VQESDMLDIMGEYIETDQIYNLHSGANLISFPSAGSVNIFDGLPDDIQDNITAIVGEGQSALNSDIGWLGTLENLEGLKGYWFIVDSEISFSYDLEQLSRSAVNYYYTENPPEDLHYNQSTEQAFYYVQNIILPGDDVQIGEWVLSYCNDILTGARQWQNEYMDIPVMGADNSDLTENYCESGDIPSFKLLRQDGELINLIQEHEIPEWQSLGVYMLGELVEELPIPQAFSLKNAYPNPFNPYTNIRFELPHSAHVKMSIYDIRGRVVQSLINNTIKAGYHSIVWDARQFASGVYFISLNAVVDNNNLESGEMVKTSRYNKTQKIMLVK
jgi:hypothetical protein